MLAISSAALAAGVEPSQATPVQREQAQSRFLRGKKLFDAKNYAGAAEEFRASHDILASPNSLLVLARSLRQEGDLVAAYVEFDKARIEAKELARDDSRYDKAGESASQERDALASKLGFVIVDVQHPAPDTTLKIGNDTIQRAGWGEPAPILPGTTVIEVETPGHPKATTSVTVSAGQTEHARLDAQAESPPEARKTAPAPPPDDHRSTMRTAAYVAGGVGAAGLVTFVVAGILSNHTYGDLQKNCGSSGPCSSSSFNDEISRGKTQQTIANIGLVAFVLGAGAGVTLFVLSQPPKDAPATAAKARVQLEPAGVSLRGAF